MKMDVRIGLVLALALCVLGTSKRYTANKEEAGLIHCDVCEAAVKQYYR